MVDDRLTDGRRIAQLLASELTGGVDRLTRLSVTDADPDVEPMTDGALAYTVRFGSDATEDGASADGPTEDSDQTEDDASEDSDETEELAEVYVQPDRVRVEFRVAPAAAAETGREQNLRVRPKAVRPPRTIVFVEDGAQVKWILPVFEAVVGAAGPT